MTRHRGRGPLTCVFVRDSVNQGYPTPYEAELA